LSVLLFPIDIISRELDYRLLLACETAGRGHQALIAYRELVPALARLSPGGVYVGRGHYEPKHRPERVQVYRSVKKADYVAVHVDEEGAVYAGGESEWHQELQRRLSATALSSEDWISTWGEMQRDMYREDNPGLAEHIVATGHPRFDLAKPPWRDYLASEVDRLRARYGDFLLVNTSYGFGNHESGAGPVLALKRDGRSRPGDADARERMARWLRERHIQADMLSLVYRLALEEPKHPIVIRPHPAEDQDVYRAVFAGLDNVHVVREGGVTPWLVAARALLHTECTTAIEATIAGTPVVTFRRSGSGYGEKWLATAFGIQVDTEDEAIDTLRALLAGSRLESPSPSARSTRLLANLERDAFPALVELIDEAASAAPGRSRQLPLAQLRRLTGTYAARRRARFELTRVLPNKRAHIRHGWSKFPGFARADVAERFTRANRVRGARARLRWLSPEALLVEPT
jgi:surface carbohydrate biosynthesis protein